jgi:hypothetical protein
LGARLSPLGMSATNWLIVPAPDDRWVWDIWWNENWQGKPKYSQNHFIHHKSHLTWPGIEHGPPWWEARDQPPELWHSLGGAMFIPFTLLNRYKDKLHVWHQVLFRRYMDVMSGRLLAVTILLSLCRNMELI